LILFQTFFFGGRGSGELYKSSGRALLLFLVPSISCIFFLDHHCISLHLQENWTLIKVRTQHARQREKKKKKKGKEAKTTTLFRGEKESDTPLTV